jgi:hypothetical protein
MVQANVRDKTVRLIIDSGGEFGLSLSAWTAVSVGAWASDDSSLRSLGTQAFAGIGSREGTAASFAIGGLRLAPVHVRIRDRAERRGVDALGILTLNQCGGALFDWEALTLTLTASGTSMPSRTWVRVPFIPMPKQRTIYSPEFTEKADALRWLTDQGDSHPGRTLAELPEHSDKPFKATAVAVIDTPLPIVRIRVGGMERDALVDTGYAGDLLWEGDVPAAIVQAGLPEKVQMWAFESAGLVERRKLAVAISIGDVRFDGAKIDMIPSGRDSSRFGYNAIIGLGLLRRQPFAFDFDHRALLFASVPNERDSAPGTNDASSRL